ncbi:MAG: hypothetical protein EOO14_16755 [Chitinophagaceae bacterium]|nr:MAG: hypothetical protein EOO14_16755 [Chitinophagaceae bacterium]
MKKFTVLLLAGILLYSCKEAASVADTKKNALPLIGTWQLLEGRVIEKGDTLLTDYTKNVSFIKIINQTHFAFLQHDLSRGKDSAAVFVAGGGTYTLKDSLYTENLEYCSAREWEGNDFSFTVTVNGDTLIQQGIEKVEAAGIDRINREKYVRVKK